MKVFISHTFAEDDQKLAVVLQRILSKENIDGYLAEKKKEYDLLIRDKIRNEIENSDHMIAIVTNKARESASVNQEIGYGLREGIKPVIMLEEDAKSGVLTHGIEPEEFTRNNFEEHCKNVIEFIQSKGTRRKITDKELEKLIENVYRPSYNQMKNVLEQGEFIYNTPDNNWTTVEYFWKLKTEPEMIEMFEQYEKERQKWSKLWVDFGNAFQSQEPKLSKIIAKPFDTTGLLHGGDHIQLDEGHTMQPRNWLRAFHFVIFDPYITNPKDLYCKLLDFATKTNNGHQQWLEKWWNDNNGIFSNILQVIPELINAFNCSVSEKQLNEQRIILAGSVEKLTLALEEKLK